MAAKKRRRDAPFDSELFLREAGVGRTVIDLKKNQILFSQGDPADAVFYIQKGTVKLTVLSQRGKEATLSLLDAGSFVGEGCVATDERIRVINATALTRATLLRIEKQEMIRVLHHEPSFADLFVSFLLDRNARIQADLVDQLFNSSEKRLARILLLLAHFGKEKKPENVVPKISQEVLAEMIGTTRSRVNFFMNPVPQARLHRLQRRRTGSAHVVVERGPARLNTADRFLHLMSASASPEVLSRRQQSKEKTCPQKHRPLRPPVPSQPFTS